jgi:hypothetical protein
MRWLTGSLAALLSLLLVSAPVSTWACDFSCSSHQALSDCHTSATTSNDDTAMSMAPGMDMGSDHSESSIGPDTVINATPGHSMSMSPLQEMVTQRFEQVTEPEMNTGATQNHSKSMSSCTHETCSQISASTSPPRAQHSDQDALCSVASSASSLLNVRTDFHWIGPGTPPPLIATADDLATILRV